MDHGINPTTPEEDGCPDMKDIHLPRGHKSPGSKYATTLSLLNTNASITIITNPTSLNTCGNRVTRWDFATTS
jgi:hypothetical protein